MNVSPLTKQITITKDDETREFSYDYVFDENSTQTEVFNEIGAPLVSHVLHGYNSTIFAYGQVCVYILYDKTLTCDKTGAGKSFTMTGVSSPSECRGLIPRSVEHLFDSLKDCDNDEMSSLIRISLLEIYLNQITGDKARYCSSFAKYPFHQTCCRIPSVKN